MVDRPASRLAKRVALQASTWLLAALAVKLLPGWLQPAGAQLLVLPVALFAWRGGIRWGLANGVVGGLLAWLLLRSDSATLGALGTPSGLAISTLVGLLVGALSSRSFWAARARQQSEARYLLASDGALDGLWDWDLEDDRVFYSRRWLSLLGYESDSIAGRPQDWLGRVHPDDVGELDHRIRAHLDAKTNAFESEHRMRHANGSWVWVSTHGLCERDVSGRAVRMTGWLRDVSGQKQAEQRLHHYAFHDALTGLPNRALFMDRVSHAQARLRRKPDGTFAVMTLDLDRFKNVNDSIGHLAGDELLCQVARRLETCISESDTVARLGGDEFAILAEQIEGAADAEKLAALVQRSISAPIRLEGHEVVTSSSIGVVLGSVAVTSPLTMLRDADQAMYRAKQQGKGKHIVYDERVHDQASQRLSLETALRTALEQGEVRAEYQPIYDLERREISGFEAFARWSHPTLGPISPREFVRLAEETALIEPLGASILDQALAALASWNADHPRERPFRLEVNVSMHELRGGNFLERAQALLASHGVPAALLGVQITEDALMQDVEAGQQALAQLHEAGMRIYLDDFGTGYSSLSYLHRFSLDALKIDGAFVSRLHEDRGAEEIVRAVTALAADLGLRVVAEGTERLEHVERLRALGCGEAQGYYFGAPTSRAEVSAMLHAQREDA